MILTELPTEILDAVAEYVPANGLRRLARTCSQLHTVALKQLWYQVRIDVGKVKSDDTHPEDRGCLCIHQQKAQVTSFATRCFCRRSQVYINHAVIDPLLVHHSKRPLPFEYVRRLYIYILQHDYTFAKAFSSSDFHGRTRTFRKAMDAYKQLFLEIIPTLKLNSILLVVQEDRMSADHMFLMVDYLATLSPAPIYMGMHCTVGILPSLDQTQLNLSLLRSVELSIYNCQFKPQLSVINSVQSQ
uniref:ARAD1D25388p n=1 Tax=Blastobotrys adeninivorans TaxID=409370 RepID=A0A060TAP3_BLAAD